MNLQHEYQNKKVLITGGLGFIGRNLAAKLVELGAKVRIADRTLKGIEQAVFEKLGYDVELVQADILDKKIMDSIVVGQDYLFSLAGHSGPVGSIEAPFLDLDVNCRGQLNILEACRQNNSSVKIIFPGSRQQFGPPRYLPVDEKHPIEPLTIYGIHKFAGERYHMLYHRFYGLDTMVLRISNPYGPHPPAASHKYNIVNWFIDLALNDETITVFGEGSQTRDYVYVGDVVMALLLAGASEHSSGEVFNVGGGEPIRFIDMAKTILEVIGKGRIQHVPWPEDYIKVETGGYVTDISKIKRVLGWEPKVSLEEGIEKTIQCARDDKSILGRIINL